MDETFTISALARRAGVSSKKIRYWERLGLLPRAARSHTGYRLFDSESLQYVLFIQKSKAIGLSLAEMQEVLTLTRNGRCPCPKVIEWTDRRIAQLAGELETLSGLLERLKGIRKQWSRTWDSKGECGDVCGLVSELPEANQWKGGKANAKTLAGASRSARGSGSHRAARSGGVCG